MGLSELTDRVKTKIQDDAETLSIADLETLIINALEQFSKDSPGVVVSDINGDGEFDYNFPSDWQEGFSMVKRVEYPAGKRVPEYLESEDWIVYDNGTDKKLRFLNHTPQVGETIRLSYTVAYLATTIDQIPANFLDALCNLAAADCCGAIARRFGFTSEPLLEADSVNYHSKGGEFARRGKELRKLYSDFLGKRNGVAAASVTMDWDTNYSWGGDYLNHPRRNR